MPIKTAKEARSIHRRGQHDAIEKRLGAMIRTLRLERGLSQAKIASGAGISFQQMQKYESGANRITVSTLIKICEGLGIPPGPLVDEIAGATAADATADQVSLSAGRATRALLSIRSDEVREAMFRLAKALAAGGL